MRAAFCAVVATVLHIQSKNLEGSAFSSVSSVSTEPLSRKPPFAAILTIGISPPANQDTWYSPLWVHPVIITTNYIYAYSALQGYDEGKSGGGGSTTSGKQSTNAANELSKKGLTDDVTAVFEDVPASPRERQREKPRR
ncbi:hypothetical protein M427DRAFT_66551 [Gonapodya prolifera JEL478]|uniref:Uncharacterized protein n=1 Tax=Gonapodya prolifera (strain JEL478) TaxID=1344416 RepID=A0A139AV35_GONPJ|nr:hypothetical protein M427DRAFT_66551 [Gonapodya prolifera JEL478]|eukprot:KXS20591.1 hypothetical protein M427DRAFT_66551 [Gonapodya prolifera JEL478]